MKILLSWGNKVSPEFRTRVVDMCKRFGWTHEHASWLMACMAFESGGTFRPNVRNAAGSKAVGLIQFMPATATALGTTDTALAAMTAEEQLVWVEKYFRPFAKRIRSLSDMYMAILLPRMIGAPDAASLFDHGIAYGQNQGLDLNRDGVVTKAEATHRVVAKLQEGRLHACTEVW